MAGRARGRSNVQVAAMGRRPPDVLVRLGVVRRADPGVHVGPDRRLGAGLFGGPEAESGGQHRLLHALQAGRDVVVPCDDLVDQREVVGWIW
jgi:hypothetical protein